MSTLMIGKTSMKKNFPNRKNYKHITNMEKITSRLQTWKKSV